MLKLPKCGMYDAEFSVINQKLRMDKNEVIDTLLSISFLKCEQYCLMHPTCLAINYNKVQQLCELLKAEYSNTKRLEESDDFSHYQTR